MTNAHCDCSRGKSSHFVTQMSHFMTNIWFVPIFWNARCERSPAWFLLQELIPGFTLQERLHLRLTVPRSQTTALRTCYEKQKLYSGHQNTGRQDKWQIPHWKPSRATLPLGTSSLPKPAVPFTGKRRKYVTCTVNTHCQKPLKIIILLRHLVSNLRPTSLHKQTIY